MGIKRPLLVLAVLLSGLFVPTSAFAQINHMFPEFQNEENPVQVNCPANQVRTFEQVRDLNLFLCVETTTFTRAGGGTNAGPFPPFPEFQPAECVGQTDLDCSFFIRFLGCFDPATKILMADGSEKEAISIKSGDEVWNPVTAKAVKIGKRVVGEEKLALLEIGFDGSTVKVTQDHPMVVKSNLVGASLGQANSSADFSVKRADQVALGDLVLGANGQYQEVTVLKQLPVVEGQVVVNFEIDTDSSDARDHMVVANGIVTGDLSVQNATKKANSL